MDSHLHRRCCSKKKGVDLSESTGTDLVYTIVPSQICGAPFVMSFRTAAPLSPHASFLISCHSISLMLLARPGSLMLCSTRKTAPLFLNNNVDWTPLVTLKSLTKSLSLVYDWGECEGHPAGSFLAALATVMHGNLRISCQSNNRGSVYAGVPILCWLASCLILERWRMPIFNIWLQISRSERSSWLMDFSLRIFLCVLGGNDMVFNPGRFLLVLCD